MALGAGLKPERHWAGAAARLFLILLIVLIAHGVAVDWLARQQVKAAALKQMAAPMFTRVLEQHAAVAAVAPPPEVAPPPAHRVRVHPAVAAAPSVPDPTPTAALSAPQATVAAVPVAPPAPPIQPAPAPPPVTESAPAAAATTPTTAPPSVAAQSLSPGASLDTWPTDTRLNYRLGGQFRSGQLYGTARVQWQRQDNRYQVRVNIDIQVFASLVLTSQGEVTPQGLRPSAYEEQRRNGIRSAALGEKDITFGNGKTAPRPDGVQDTASQFVDLSHRFATGQEKLQVGRSISFWLARPGGVDLWTYDVVEKEILKSPTLGDIEAFHLKPRPIANPRGNIFAEMWFAPSLQYLPVRIRVNIGDEANVDLLVEKIEQR